MSAPLVENSIDAPLLLHFCLRQVESKKNKIKFSYLSLSILLELNYANPLPIYI
jgi:hypothetical protein